MVSIICIIAKNRAIGFQNKLLYNIPEDMRHFREITTGHVIIMGKNTFHSINDNPLPNRINIIITRDKKFLAQNCLIANSIEESIELAKKQNKGEIFFIGGSQIYEQAIPFVNKLYLTIVDDKPKQADTFFPDYSEFKKIVIRKESELNVLKFKFVELEK
ncbi:dihydrofolate reductase [Patescibacteria group bacterium]|nr:dihydrofolate reductase [Patescibacteria group bacterium]MBU0879360.1 dihydrofolate reductase [Patescibacteria group bacterium]MBU0880032.1 dihydrofolate reductase [Patescibacteria group bacterium]MBU0897540.1 dihydrofolate reductase [Patescibacteria group bacterium]MBU1783217.1 dihydrofolate reductase [Patescibacteria group bacterium]